MKSKLKCPFCEKEFPAWYWAVSGKTFDPGTRKFPGIAYANFRRHVKACNKKYYARIEREMKHGK